MKRVRVWSTVGIIGLAMMTSAAAPPGRFVVNAAAGTVRDTTSNLTWQRAVPGIRYTWSQAKTYCQGLNLGGFSTGWRLPTRKELGTLVDFRVVNPSIDVTAFPNTPSDAFWTSTPYAGSSGNAWYVAFSYGNSDGNGTTNTYSVRCVR